MDLRPTEQVLAHLAAIVEFSDDAIISKTLDGVITSWNRGAERLYGYRADEVVGQSIGIIIPEECLGEEPRILERLKRGELIDHYETVRRRKDGVLLDVSVTISPIRDSAGRIVGASKIARDITERKRAEHAIRQLNSELEARVTERTAQLRAANQDLETFSYSVSHDLRAPLRHIQGFVDILRESRSLTPEEHSYLDKIVGSVRRMNELIGALLTFSRTGAEHLRLVPIDTGRMVEETIQEIIPPGEKARVEWRIGPLPNVCGDATLLKLVWANLLSNAVKFSREQQSPRVEIRAETRDGMVEFRVRDNGVGFDSEAASSGKLFGLFERLHPANRFEGSGIGLANVRRIIETHGGKIWAESKPDRGATFAFTLPRSAPDDGPVPAVRDASGIHQR